MLRDRVSTPFAGTPQPLARGAQTPGMQTSEAFVGLDCVDCGTRFDPAEEPGRCPDCGGILDPAYDYDRVDLSPERLADREEESMWRYAELLPFPAEAAVSRARAGRRSSSVPNSRTRWASSGSR